MTRRPTTTPALPRAASLAVAGFLAPAAAPFALATGGQIKFIDLAYDPGRQVVVDREPGQYLGHPTTLLLEDGTTILCVYPKGHGRGAIVYKRSTDGGLTWSERLPTPASWETSQETPTIHRVTDASGKRRVVLFSGLYPVRMAVSEDDGLSWSGLEPVGDWGGIVTMSSVVPVSGAPGHYLALFHDDGRFFREYSQPADPRTVTLYSSRSSDGGLTWGEPVAIHSASDLHLCEPGAVRSPDGKQLCVLLRENARRKPSHVIFSDDEGKTWSPPREVPLSLTGDRHVAVHAPDGRLFISFRGRRPDGPGQMSALAEAFGPLPGEGDWIAWVGTYDDIVHGRPGQYLVRVMDNKVMHDTTYPGVELLPDGTIVTTTYGHWTTGEEPYIASVRLRLDELDARAEGAPVFAVEGVVTERRPPAGP